ncbi:MAG: sulfite exporter TauE/SafE family protein [Clostridia bacterium]
MSNVAFEHQKEQKRSKYLLIFFGLFVGFLNGLFGGGGGMLLIPCFTILAKVNEKEAHATAIATILPLSIATAIIYIKNNGFDFGIGLPVGVGFLIGGILGTILLKKLSNQILQFVFYGVMIFAGVKMI